MTYLLTSPSKLSKPLFLKANAANEREVIVEINHCWADHYNLKATLANTISNSHYSYLYMQASI